MTLSKPESRRLAAIEHALQAEDPRLAARLSRLSARLGRRSPGGRYWEGAALVTAVGRGFLGGHGRGARGNSGPRRGHRARPGTVATGAHAAGPAPPGMPRCRPLTRMQAPGPSRRP
ncbi:MAG TPA: hypothetical protein DHU96_21930 [Actinobacteria bacterium]|nr:hypothetical protein [Actinomycetota bacterium]